ncbi:MAG: right-handed parallel beta-helix repeat-containing protein [Oscillospiraceae bacterium]|nr:right-handed parallel beta-helix repeat-containing protein [Oscillospiraceae bacterium]
MKRIKSRRLSALLLALVLALSGCAEKTPQNTPGTEPAPQETQTAQQETPAAQQETPAAPDAPDSPAEDAAVHVASVEELLDAIAPNAEIVIEPGRYNLSEYTTALRAQSSFGRWSDSHAYVALRDVFDGVEIVIRNADGLTIRGGGDDPKATELVTEPRYATVLCYEHCGTPQLACLTMGHTDYGDCSGDVVSFLDCTDVRLDRVDLYGCGVYGVAAVETAGLRVTDSAIHDCQYGPLNISSCTGELSFERCALTGSNWGGFYEPNHNAVLRFVSCTFGEQESNAWYFSEEAIMEDCVWSEITQYPDYSGVADLELPDFDPKQMGEIAFNRQMLENTWWTGHATVNPDNGAIGYLGYAAIQQGVEAEYASLQFYSDGTATLDYRGETEKCTWECMDSTLAILEHGGARSEVSMFQASGDGEDGTLWLRVNYAGEQMWFY